ncbi:MAG: F0F1 ATP synthase subunit A [bacterium]
MVLPPLAAETIAHIGSFPITNAFVNSFIVAMILIVTAFFVRRNMKTRANQAPTGVQNFAEAVVEFLMKQAVQVTGDEAKARKFLPLAGTVFLFVLLNNWLGLFPGMGSIGFNHVVNGEAEFFPLLRSAGSDLNLTIAIAITSIVATNVFGVMSIGFFSHVGKFLNFKGFLHAWHEHGIGAKLVGFLVAIVELGVGLIEIVSELAKVLSLSLRLFGNVFAGEVLMAVMAGLFAYFLPLPFMALELIVGVVQATVFAMLVLVYATVSTQEAH